MFELFGENLPLVLMMAATLVIVLVISGGTGLRFKSEPAPKLCRGCGVSSPSFARFCRRCGRSV